MDPPRSEAVEPSSEPACDERRGPRRLWSLPIWFGTLATIYWWFRAHEKDPGVTNTVMLGGVVLGLMGLGVWTIRSSGLRGPWRWIFGMAPTALVAAFFLQLLPVMAINDGAGRIVGFRWRWAAPDRELESAPTRSSPGETSWNESALAAESSDASWQESPSDYPRFLGRGHWAEVQGVALDPDWKNHKPRELWRQKIGAGWSGFATVGDYAVTQEQRGEQELVACYEIATGRPVWTHVDDVRWDPRGPGALGYSGPRATPTIHKGRVFSLGATGILNCLDVRTGRKIWSHDTLAEHGAENVMWGKANSPLVVDDLVIVSVGAKDGASLVAYKIDGGEQAWASGKSRSSYASPLLTTLAGQRQILSVDESQLASYQPDDGTVLWQHPWPSESDSAAAASQPVPLGDDRVLLSMGYGRGAEVIQVGRSNEGMWTAKTYWKNPGVLKTKMENVVIRDGYAYGLSDTLLQCVDLATGRSAWKKRRTPSFGYGQILLVDEYILILTEDGEVALADVNPKKYVERGSFPAIEGITWNNPTLVGGWLLVRNAEEAACFELPLAEPREN